MTTTQQPPTGDSPVADGGDGVRVAVRHRVELDDGVLSALEWGTERGDSERSRVVLAAHGITASAGTWQLVADRLDDTRVIAPDLRGRGRSNRLPGPFGLDRQADDLARLLDELDLDRVVFAGHSLGAYVAVRFAERHRDRLQGLVLVDGGLPMPAPTDGAAASPRALLGPAYERLTRTFASPEEYLDFWRPHPAFAPMWGPVVERALLDGLDAVDADGRYRASADIDAVAENLAEFVGGDGYRDALVGLTVPTTFVRPGHGILGGDPLYSAEQAESWLRFVRSVTTVEAPDANHYSVVFGTEHAGPVVEAIRAQIGIAVAREAARAAHPATGRIRVIRPD